MSLDERKNKLFQNGGGGIPMPQSATGLMHMQKSGSSFRGEDQAEPSVVQNMVSAVTSAAEEAYDSFRAEPDSMNSVAMSRPIINPAARRRPSQINVGSMIPQESRLEAKDIIVDDSSKKRPQDSLGEPPGKLSATEQWLADKLVLMEKTYLARIALLEQETALLRAALVAGGITVAPKPAPPTLPASSSPIIAAEKSSSQSPTAKRAPPAVSPRPANSSSSPLASGGLVRRFSSAEGNRANAPVIPGPRPPVGSPRKSPPKAEKEDEKEPANVSQEVSLTDDLHDDHFTLGNSAKPAEKDEDEEEVVDDSAAQNVENVEEEEDDDELDNML